MHIPDLHITILAGGSGTRLWPLSRQQQPKQLLNLQGERSMLQRTVDRVLPLVPPERIYILTGPDHAASIAAQLPDLPAENILIEPGPRGTAPCLGLAALKIKQRYGGSAVMLSLHADHVIANEDAFRATLREAVATARRGHLVTVGIVPTGPETGFGYIEREHALPSQTGCPVYSVARFTEKPPLEQAKVFVASGMFYWNAGYFAWTLDAITDEFERLLPATYAHLNAMLVAQDPLTEWNQIARDTIDVGIMEKAASVAVVHCDMGWNDVGSWAAMYDISEADADGNVLLGDGQVIAADTHNTLIRSNKRLVATIGLKDYVIIDTDDALLVLPRDRAQDVSQLVKDLRSKGLEEYL